ncbi:MAG: segregation/condensation protein A [Kiritimatiellia bacterium]|jgi:segregation and condensation protein A|nr:segregation/condensation protein A [Kiritimatiellia bacterium]
MSIEALLPDEYKVDLEVFEGPLDLLLYLIRREEVDIYDIPIERITAQYLAYLDVMRMLDLNIAGEFLVMAATLMMIKSRMLLPVEARAAEEESDETWVDPRLDLVRQLIEYKKFKDAANRLLEWETLQGEVFTFGGEQPVLERGPPDAGQALGDIGLFDLLTAFQEVLARAPMEPLGHIEPIRWSVPDKMEAILTLTRGGNRVAFSALFNPESHRGEVIVTFLALLELLRLRQITLWQNEAFHEILILPAEETGGGLLPVPVIGGGEHVQA